MNIFKQKNGHNQSANHKKTTKLVVTHVWIFTNCAPPKFAFDENNSGVTGLDSFLNKYLY